MAFGRVFIGVLAAVLFAFPMLLTLVGTLGVSLQIFLLVLLFVVGSSAVPIRFSRRLDTERTIRARVVGRTHSVT